MANGRSRFKTWTSFLLGVAVFFLLHVSLEYTSTNEFCAACHIHPQATTTWKISTHNDTKSGVVTACVDCHLPPSGLNYLQAKISTGTRDLYATLFTDTKQINWEEKSNRAAATRHVFKAACLNCHKNLYPRELSQKGQDAHLYYDQKPEKLRCINCHLEVGHFHEKRRMFETRPAEQQTYLQSTVLDTFSSFNETIPGSAIAFEMIAIPGGQFTMGSPSREMYRAHDEGPQKEVAINSFWLGKTEVSWTEFDAYYRESSTERNSLDAITGPTPPYGNPDQGWGRGSRPAITMTHFAAQKYCEWLSEKTGKAYRLPTESEWEYACRANTSGAYFIPGEPENYDESGFWDSLFGVDTTGIARYIVYKLTSGSKTQRPDHVKSNPFGLLHMLGNVWEFCADPYDPEAYETSSTVNKTNIQPGTAYVIRGGSFRSTAGDIRIANRDYTRDEQWLLTDPQIPKSRWWYSDCFDVGFRVALDDPRWK